MHATPSYFQRVEDGPQAMPYDFVSTERRSPDGSRTEVAARCGIELHLLPAVDEEAGRGGRLTINGLCRSRKLRHASRNLRRIPCEGNGPRLSAQLGRFTGW